MKGMKSIRMAVAVVVVIAAVASFSLASSANAPQKDYTIGKKGVIHFNVPVKVGDTALPPGMYQLQHVVEGNDHILTFKSVEMPAGYRHGNTPVSKEVSASFKCKVEPAEKVNKTRITLRTNAAGEKAVSEVQVAGEAFKHIL